MEYLVEGSACLGSSYNEDLSVFSRGVIKPAQSSKFVHLGFRVWG